MTATPARLTAARRLELGDRVTRVRDGAAGTVRHFSELNGAPVYGVELDRDQDDPDLFWWGTAEAWAPARRLLPPLAAAAAFLIEEAARGATADELAAAAAYYRATLDAVTTDLARARR